MAGFNRGRYCVVLGDGWLNYVTPGFEFRRIWAPLGVITVGKECGALLLKRETGDYYLYREDRMPALLVIEKVTAAIAKGDDNAAA